MDNLILNCLAPLVFLLFLICLLVIWVFTFRTTFRKMREPGTTRLQQLLYLSGCLAAPLVVMFDAFIGLAEALLKLFGALGGVILFALALLISPLLLIIYLGILSLKKASVLGERYLQRTIDFPGRIEKRFTQILVRLRLVQKPPDPANPR